LTKPPASSEEYFLARSTASLMTTFTGVSVARISCIAVHRQSKNRAIDGREAVEAPVGGVFADQFVERGGVMRRAFKKLIRESRGADALFQKVGSSFSGICWLMSH